MKCPFRITENKDFADCYGADCMAYFEYAPPPVTFGQTDFIAGGQPSAPMCKRMLSYAPYTSGCAV